MNEHFSAFIDLGRRIANENRVNWNVRLQSDGTALPEDAWNITEFVGDSPPPVHWVRDFGLDTKALQALNERRKQQNCPALPKTPLSPGWLDLLKAVTVEQLFFRKNSTGHVICNVARPLRVLATAVEGREPWELRVDDVAQAFELAKEIQASGKLADMVLGLVKTLIDANHIADIGPISPALSLKRHGVREKRARHTKSMDELRSDLEERKHAEKLPERRAFWELVRIVFTEQPKSVLDLLRFAQAKVIMLCGLRVGEACLLPADWKRVREYFDPSGRAAGELGGHSTALMLRHFAEKQQTSNSDSVALFETAQYVPSMFEAVLSETLDEVSRVTQPLRETLRRQVAENRILPWFRRDQLVSAIELYPYLTGNPVLLPWSDEKQEQLKSRYRTGFQSQLFDEIHKEQLRQVIAAPSLISSLYMFYNRLKGQITFRRWDGTEWRDTQRMRWSEVFLRIDEVEDYLLGITTKLSDRSPFRISPSGEIQTWELMFLMPKRALAEGRNDGLCDITRYYSVGRFSPDMMQLALGGKEGKSSGPTLFESYSSSDEDRALTLNPHTLRHLQNTELFRLGVADTIITKRFNRRSVAQSYEYDHRSLAEELEDIELPVEVEAALGSKAATVARMIKAGKASGPIVDSFKNIQRTHGDDAAFEFLKVEADGFHSTPYGHCINSFTVDPCPKHLECFAGCRHLTATDMPKYRTHLVQLEGRFKEAVKAIESRSAKTIGRDNQLTHAKNRLDAVRQILVTPEGMQVFPEGADLSKSDSNPGSVLDAHE
ncbi:hypothetical protein [Azospira inquinata]|uniref:Integrase n=1 Tax=Azospira inquinata TaxID=2785627 RepID=A0A975SMB3_9RHOO|nr:hypothetical protein [Azospira inquinata]QWT45734.1 hypothetical protein J8L76_12470 [Azospira inquinata]QWT48942.1 hypothetical protein Azoinq_14140 [Azospira inquinata]